MKESFVELNNINFAYEIHGEGYPLILLHGFAMYKEFWKWQARELSKDFKIITLDIRGCGKTDHPVEPFSMEDLADDVKALMDYLNILLVQQFHQEKLLNFENLP